MDFTAVVEKVFFARILEDEELLNRFNKIVDGICSDEKTMNELVAEITILEEELGSIMEILNGVLELCLNGRSTIFPVLKKVLSTASPASDSKDVLL